MERAFFDLFGVAAIVAALGVVLARNTMYSVLWLIFCFFNLAGLFVLLDAEFLGVILILVYVGAVMVLFMFVVMMLEVDIASLREGFLRYLPLGGTLALVLLVEMVLAARAGVFARHAAHLPPGVDNTAEIGKLLYTKYLLGFEIAAVILLVALVGAIVLTIRARKDARYQNIARQVRVRKEDRLRKVRLP